jgi:hypothetical protein
MRKENRAWRKTRLYLSRRHDGEISGHCSVASASIEPLTARAVPQSNVLEGAGQRDHRSSVGQLYHCRPSLDLPEAIRPAVGSRPFVEPLQLAVARTKEF